MRLVDQWRHVFTQELGWDAFSTTLHRGDVDLHGVGEKRGIGAYYVEPDAFMVEALRKAQAYTSNPAAEPALNQSKFPGWYHAMQWRERIQSACEDLRELHAESIIIAGCTILRPSTGLAPTARLSSFPVPSDIPWLQDCFRQTVRFTLQEEDDVDLQVVRGRLSRLFGNISARTEIVRTCRGLSPVLRRGLPGKDNGEHVHPTLLRLLLLLLLEPEYVADVLERHKAAPANEHEIFIGLQGALRELGTQMTRMLPSPSEESTGSKLPGTVPLLAHSRAARTGLVTPPISPVFPRCISNEALRTAIAKMCAGGACSLSGIGPGGRQASLLAFTDLLFEKPPAPKNNARMAMRLAMAMMAGMPNSTEMEQVYSGMALHPDSYSLYTFLDPICRLAHARSAVGAP